MDLEIPTGQPLVYDLNDDLTVAKNTTYKFSPDSIASRVFETYRRYLWHKNFCAKINK